MKQRRYLKQYLKITIGNAIQSQGAGQAAARRASLHVTQISVARRRPSLLTMDKSTAWTDKRH